jgi:predicted amidohydrolase
MGFHLGYAELVEQGGTTHRYNTAIHVDKTGQIVGKYRKVHLPGHAEFDPERKFQHLEKRYFEVGDLGFPVWRTARGIFGIAICNDRRWPEAYRVMGLQGVEMIMIGYNTPTVNSQSDESPHLRMFHNHLSLQAGAYQNSAWVVGVAKAGDEDGNDLMGGSVIVAPSGQIVAECRTLEDELVVADCDLDACAFGKRTIFNFAAHRRIEHYGLITERTGAIPPPE